MYCPVCLNETLMLNSKGIADLIINKKQLDNGKILFSSQTNPKDFWDNFDKRLDEFCSWYSRFNNKYPITTVELISNSLTCESGCKLAIDLKKSVIGPVITSKKVMESLHKACKKYGLDIKITLEELESQLDK